MGARVEDTTGPDCYIPSAYYVCAPRGHSLGNHSPDTRLYPRQQIRLAMNAGFMLSLDRRRITAANGRQYPERFYVRGPNAANFNIPYYRQINSNRLVEFPIIRNDAGQYVPFTEGDDQGPDCVVFDGATGYFAGVFTHRGEVNNNFHRALGHNQDVKVPTIDVDLGPTILDADPFGCFTGGSGNHFPMKRNPTLPSASFPITYSGCPSSSGQCYCYDTVTAEGWYPRVAALQAIDWNGQTVPTSDSSMPQFLSITEQITYNNTEWSINMSVWQTLLVGAAASTVDQQSCITALRSAMDNCQTDSVDEKIGGEYIFYIDGVGSQQFTTHPGNGNPAPPTKYGEQNPFDT